MPHCLRQSKRRGGSMRSLLLLLAFLTVASLGVLALESGEDARIEQERLERVFYSAWSE